MPSNSQIRSLQFTQGVEVELPDGTLNESDSIALLNNTSSQDTGISFSLYDYASYELTYVIRRRTDSNFKRIERGIMRVTIDDDGATDADKFILSFPFRDDEGSASGVTFSLDVTDPENAKLLASTTNLAGANHSCKFSYNAQKLIA